MENKLEVIIKDSGLEGIKADQILTQFQDYFKIAEEWNIKAKNIIVTDASQKVDMQMARTGKLFLREKRIAIENTRKSLKEQSLREGKAIDGISNVLKALIIPIEEYLNKQEKFVELKEEQKKEAIRLEVEKKMEDECIAKEKAEEEERERIKLENEQLKKEAEERERKHAEEKAKQEKILRDQQAKAEKEKAETEAKANAEKERLKKEAEENLEKERQKAQEEKAKVEAELKAKKDAEEKAEKERLDEIEKRKKASDDEKLTILQDDLCNISFPDVNSQEARTIITKIKALLLEAINLI